MSTKEVSTEWTIARLKVEGRETLPQKYQEFVLLRGGERVGSLKWKYRPKNAGGYAWEAKLFGLGGIGNADIGFFHYDKTKALSWVKERYPSPAARKQRFAEQDAIYAAIYAAEEAEAIPA